MKRSPSFISSLWVVLPLILMAMGSFNFYPLHALAIAEPVPSANFSKQIFLPLVRNHGNEIEVAESPEGSGDELLPLPSSAIPVADIPQDGENGTVDGTPQLTLVQDNFVFPTTQPGGTPPDSDPTFALSIVFDQPQTTELPITETAQDVLNLQNTTGVRTIYLPFTSR